MEQDAVAGDLPQWMGLNEDNGRRERGFGVT